MPRKPSKRRRVATVVMLLIVTGFGCNPLLAPFKLLNINKTRLHSKYEFYERASKAKDKKDIKVAVLSYRGRTLSPDSIGAERTLTNMFVATLKAGFEKNKERVTIVPVGEVEKFKQQNDDWRAMEGHEIARKLGVDYIIDVELAGLNLYEPGSRLLFRGSCRIPIRVIDADKNAETPEMFADEFTMDFPGGGVTIPADQEMNAEKFQNQFMAKVAVELTSWFTGIETRQRFQ